MRLNNKGMTIVEIILTFSIVMVMIVSMLSILFNYREDASISLTRLTLDTFKNTLTKDIQNDILKRGVKEMNQEGECSTLIDLNSCVNIVFNDGTSKVFGTSKVDENNRSSIENKYLYYDGLKYKLKDELPKKIPIGRKATDFQRIQVEDRGILSADSMILEDGTVAVLYSIDVYIAHINFEKDFGIHIVAYSERTQNES